MAQAAELTIACVGSSPLLEGEEGESLLTPNNGDRDGIRLPASQVEYIKQLAIHGAKIVLVVTGGSPLALGEVEDLVEAIVFIWYPGQAGGKAVADVLFGSVNPSGKLPMSFPRSAGHLPCYYNYKPSARRGYLKDDVTPLYPFGYGLSYTAFKFSNLRLEKSTIRPLDATRVFVDVGNTGTRTGQEVVQMYIRDRVSSVTRPVKELKGFTKITLQPGETKTVTLPLFPEHLAFTTVAMEYAVEPGDFEIMVGSSSRDEDLMTTLLHVID